MKPLRTIFLPHLLATLMCIATSAGNVWARMSIKASVDSSAITMGYQSAIKFEIINKVGENANVALDKAKFPPQVEIVDWVYGDTTDLGNGLVEMKRALIIQTFDSGVYNIPPFIMVTGPDTVRSNNLTIKVNPVDVSQMTDINPLADPAEFTSKWYDFLPDWITDYWYWILISILVIAGAVVAYLIMTKKVDVAIVPQKKRLPPDQIAFNRLNALKDAQLWEKGQEKEYYTRLIDILRDYLQERFGINAMEMTSTQIIKALSNHEETRLPKKHMQKVVEIADYVKFAKVRPLPDDNVRSFQNAVSFVEETRPIPTVNENSEEGKPVVTPDTTANKGNAITNTKKEN